MLAFCRAEYGAVHRWRGRWSEAEALLEAAIVDFAHSRPAWAPGPLTGLAELRRRQGRTTEALELLDRAGATTHLCHAQIALDRGDTRAAAELADRLPRQIGAERRLAPRRLTRRVGARALIVRAAATELRELAELAGTAPLKAIADRAGGRRPRRPGLLEDAVDGFAGAPLRGGAGAARPRPRARARRARPRGGERA